MSQKQGILSEFSMEELESELKRRRLENDAKIHELCAMWKLVNPQFNEYIDWHSSGFEREPNLVLDACLCCSNAESIKVVAKEFPEQAVQEDRILSETPLELFLRRCNQRDRGILEEEENYDFETPPGDQAAIQIFHALYDAKHFPVLYYIECIVLGH
ncbi:expressed unknown protein [Seminavis robusta]|uniref:Uncharacterized protein n=1 Tax=Seminavis robusta TaxID=568900 RepID=A0A9N8HWY5_9STRA|nr:expressed unknown protein [Seminavis robusta]|eukprot:Sro1718_g293340.1 n/a (158) ;mRNA; r:15211-15893